MNPKGARFACYDMLMTIAPGMLLTIVSVLFNAIIVFLSLTGAMSTGIMVASSLSSILFCLLNYFIFMFMFGVLTTFVEWDSIRSTTGKKVLYMFTFRCSCSPTFPLLWWPGEEVQVEAIQHSISVDVAELSDAASAAPQKQRERTM